MVLSKNLGHGASQLVHGEWFFSVGGAVLYLTSVSSL